MSYGRNLENIINNLCLTKKLASEKIGIHINTLSNIINGTKEPNEKTKIAINEFLKANNIPRENLYKEKVPIPNIRIYTKSTLSGIEKANMRNCLMSFEEKKEILQDLKPDLYLDNFFDMYVLPYKGYDLYPAERRKKLLELINGLGDKNPIALANFFYDKKIRDLLDINPIVPSTPYCITSLIECLGIRIIFMAFGTDKIASFSTSLFENTQNPNWIEPTIAINNDVCNTAEKTHIQLAKELYFMLMCQKDFSALENYAIDVVSKEDDDDAEIFAENLLLPREFLSEYIESERNWKNSSLFYKVNILKSHFNVGYTLAIKQLFKVNQLTEFSSTEETENEYLSQIKFYYADSDAHLPNLNGEPNPLPLSLRGTDFFECAILSAWKKGIPRFSGSETATLLNCKTEDLEKKYRKEKYLIDAMIVEK